MSTIALAKNLIYHERSKYINIIFYFIREHTKDKYMKLLHIRTNKQLLNILTKSLKLKSSNISHKRERLHLQQEVHCMVLDNLN